MFQVAKLRADARIPCRANPGDAGLDLASVENAIVPARGKAIVDTGLAFSMPPDCYGRIAPRSGLAAKHSIDVLAGVIDSSYRDSLKVIMINHSDTDYKVSVGDRIAQLIFERIYICDPCEVAYEQLSATQRGTYGFGSSGN
jgi:dUTP pyrophosphatase